MEHRVIGPLDILAHMAVTGESGLYVVGCFERRVTLYSQQVRSLNLVYALFHEMRLKAGDTVAVIGGSVAGMTVAAGAARLGCNVILLEQRDQLLPLLRGNHSRWLHPHIYDWPTEGSERADAGLPLLNWKAAPADNVAMQIERAWEALPERSRITVHCNVKSIDLVPGSSRHLTWNASGPDFGDFAAVILAVGFGLEREVKNVPWRSYWQDDDLHQPSLKGVRHHLISGCGDGGLVDLLRVRIRDFRHELLLAEFLGSVPEELRKRLLQIDEEARGERNPNTYLFRSYKSLAVPEVLDAAIELRLRADTSAVLNGREPTPLTLGACIVNRFLVSRLLFRFGVEYRSGEFKSRKKAGRYEVTFASGKPEIFDHIVCRHGPSPTALEEGFRAISAKCTGMRDMSALDQTRWPIFGETFNSSIPRVEEISLHEEFLPPLRESSQRSSAKDKIRLPKSMAGSEVAELQIELDAFLLPEVQAEQASHLQAFVGRERELQRAREWAEKSRSGYLLIVGPPGQGKSAFSAALATEEGAILHMVKSHPDPLRFLPALTAAVSQSAGSLPPLMALRGTLDDLRNGLVDALRRLVGAKGRALIVIDALDEVNEPFRSTLNFLPVALPMGALVVLTTRANMPLVQRLRVRLPITSEWHLEPLQMTDFEASIRRQIPLEMHGSISASELNDVFNRLRGNALLLRRAVDIVARTLIAGKDLTDVFDKIPTDLEDFFSVIYDEISDKTTDIVAGRRRSELIQLLAIAQEPMRMGDLAEIMSSKGEHLSMEACRDHCRTIAQYLLHAQDGRVKPWHQGLSEFVGRSILGTHGIQQKHTDFCEWMEQQPAADYAMRHRIRHLVDAGQVERVAALLLDPKFLREKVRRHLAAELMWDLELAVAVVPLEARQALELLAEALRLEMPVLVRHPEALYQVLRNRLRWHDSPEAAVHFALGHETVPPWAVEGFKIADWISRWPKPEGPWLDAIRPTSGRLGSGQVGVFPAASPLMADRIAVAYDGSSVVALQRTSSNCLWTCCTIRDGGVREHDGKCLGLLKDPMMVATLGDRAIRIVDALRGIELRKVPIPGHVPAEDHTRVSVDDSVKRLACGGKNLSVWDLRSGERLYYSSPERNVRWGRPEFAPGGCRITVFRYVDSRPRKHAEDDSELWLIDLGTGKRCVIGLGYSKVAFDSHAGRCAVTSVNGGVRLIDAATGATIRVLGVDERWIEGASFSPDGRLLVTGGNGVLVWDIETGAEMVRFSDHLGLVRDVAFFHDGRRVASWSDDNTIRIWQIDKAGANIQLIGHDSSIMDLAFSPDGSMLASIGLWDDSLRIWDVASGVQLKSLRGALEDPSYGVQLQWIDNQRLVGVDGAGKFVLWDIANCLVACELQLITPSEIDSVPLGVSPDGNRIALPRTEAGDHPAVLSLHDGSVLCPLQSAGDQVFQFVWSLDGKMLVASGLGVAVMDGETGELLWKVPRLPSRQLHSIALSPDGEYLCVVGCEVEVWSLRDRRIFWSTRSGKRRRVQSVVSNAGFPSCLTKTAGLHGIRKRRACLRKGKRTTSGRRVRVIWGRRVGVTLPTGTPYFSPDGRRVAVYYSLLTSSVLRIFDTGTGRLMETVEGAVDPNLMLDPRWWRVIGNDFECVFTYMNGEPWGWAPAMDTIRVSPKEDVVAGAHGHQLYLIRVRGTA